VIRDGFRGEVGSRVGNLSEDWILVRRVAGGLRVCVWLISSRVTGRTRITRKVWACIWVNDGMGSLYYCCLGGIRITRDWSGIVNPTDRSGTRWVLARFSLNYVGICPNWSVCHHKQDQPLSSALAHCFRYVYPPYVEHCIRHLPTILTMHVRVAQRSAVIKDRANEKFRMKDFKKAIEVNL
jgi:hypothetical protein